MFKSEKRSKSSFAEISEQIYSRVCKIQNVLFFEKNVGFDRKLIKIDGIIE